MPLKQWLLAIMPIENKTIIQVLALAIGVVIPALSATIILFSQVARIDERVYQLRQNQDSYEATQAQIEKLETEVENLRKASDEMKSTIRNNLRDSIDEQKTLRKSVSNAREYVRNQLDKYREEYHQLVVNHIMDHDSHSKSIEVKKTR